MNAQHDFQMRLELAIADAMAEQGFTERRKNTIAALVGGVLQVVNLSGGLTTDMPWWATAIIAVLLFVAEAIFHATSETAIAPSVGRKLSKAAADRAPGGESPVVEDVPDIVRVPIVPEMVSDPLALLAAVAERNAVSAPRYKAGGPDA